MPFAVNNLPCQDPDLLRKQFGSALDLLQGCNSYTCPLGDAVGYAHVLMDKADFDRINGTAYVTLTIRDGYGTTLTLPDLTVVGSAAAYQTDSSRRANAVVRVTLADRRWRYKMVAVNRQYNYRDSANNFITASTNGGTAWTWQGVVNDLWAKLVTPFGVNATGPQFPTSPAGTPEGFSFYGVDVYAAINRVVQAAGFVLRFDPTTRGVSIVNPTASPQPIPTTPPRTFDDGLWTDPAVWATAPLYPENLRVYFPRVQRPDAHAVTVATLRSGAAAGTFGEAWDDMPAVGATVSNTTALSNRADAILRLWEYDRLSRANPNRIEFRGWQDWCRTNIGYGSWTRWAVYDRGNSSDGLIGGVLSSVNNLDPLRVEYRPGSSSYQYVPLNTQNVDATDLDADTTDIRADQSTYIEFESVAGPPAYQKLKLNLPGLEDYLADELALVTANVNGTEESTTTRLEFSQSTGVRVDSGATDADPDIVSLTFGQLITYVSNVCPTLTVTKNGSGLVTDVSLSLSVEKRTLTVSDGATVGEPLCTVNPDDCCPDVTVDCCENAIPSILTLTISGGGGDYPAIWDGTGWVTGLITVPGCGTVNLKLSCSGTDASGFGVGNQITPSAGDCVWATAIGGDPATCNPFELVVDGVFSGVGCSCGLKTLTWSVPV